MSKRILLIDDDEITTGLLGRVLNREGFEVIVSDNGLEGVRLAREYRPEIVILDFTVSEMTGWQVCKEIRTFSDVHILIFSAISDPKIVAKTLDAGANNFLCKLTSITAVFPYINKMVNSTPGQMSTSPMPFILQNS